MPRDARQEVTLFSFDVRKAWDNVLPGLSEIKALTNAEWRCEDIYARCLMQKAFLFMPSPDSQDFVILSDYKCPYSGDQTLSILAAYSKSGVAVERFQPEIERLAREANCVSVEFSSPRNGWQRLAPKHGYEPVLTVFRKAIDG